MKNINLLSLLFLFSSVFAEEQDMIDPFGSILWEDSFLEVVQKVGAMSPDTVLLNTVDIKNLVSQKELSDKLKEVVQKHVPQFFDPVSLPRMESKIVKYRDAEGKEQKHISEFYIRYSIEVSPVVILGVVFKMEISFAMAPGLAIHHPDGVLRESSVGYSFPIVLKEIQLTSRSPGLEDKHKKITEILQKKYQKFDVHNRARWDKINIMVSLKDDRDNQLVIRGGSTLYMITYIGKAYIEELDQKYRRHLSKINSSKHEGMESGL